MFRDSDGGIGHTIFLHEPFWLVGAPTQIGDGLMSYDFAARSLATQNRSAARRLATIEALSRGIAENMPTGIPEVMATPIAESRASATAIASGTTYGFSNSTPSADRTAHFAMYGADYVAFGASLRQAITGLNGNGTDPSATPSVGASSTVRFATFADKFEIIAHNYLGFRVLVNGKHAKTGMYGVSSLNGDAANTRYWLFDFEGTEFEGKGLKLVEVQGHFDMRFGGVRVPVTETVSPWPQPQPIRLALHGDSMPNTVIDSTPFQDARHGLMPHIVQMLTGIPDIHVHSQGGCGFFADNSGARSDFVEHAGVNYANGGFDLLWEVGGKNDTSAMYGTQAAYQARVEEWIEIVLGGNPDAIIIVTGSIPSSTAESYANYASSRHKQDAKKAAAAKFPRNCAFIETVGNAVTDNPWVYGSGKAGASAGNGNADLVTGTDGVHLSVFGHEYIGTRLVAETARVLPLLASRIRDGVIAGVNDGDLV